MSKTTRRVRKAFDADALRRITVEQDFTDWGCEYVPLKGKDRFYWHRKSGSKILAVAHLDSVHQGDNSCHITDTANGLFAASGAMDDRLGAMVILDLFPKLGITTDILLTTDEEQGRSTAEYFETDVQYDHVIQFDRGGTDVVLYEYDDKDLRERVKAAGASVGRGSFSDICMLEHLECKAMNWGVGYYDYHGPRGHAWLEDTFAMVAKYLRFQQQNAGIHLPHEEYVPLTGNWGRVGSYSRSWNRTAAKAVNNVLTLGGDTISAEEWLATHGGSIGQPTADYVPRGFVLEFCPECGEKLREQYCAGCDFDWTDDSADMDEFRDDEAAYTRWLALHDGVGA